jgi:hypothetical protein
MGDHGPMARRELDICFMGFVSRLNYFLRKIIEACKRSISPSKFLSHWMGTYFPFGDAELDSVQGKNFERYICHDAEDIHPFTIYVLYNA